MNEDEWDEVLQRFREEGVDTDLPDDRKLLYIWRWLVDAETNCISLRHQLDKLSRRQSEELEDIRSCMEQMCNAWEVKISKLEDENKCFQDQLNFEGRGPGPHVSQQIRQLIAEDGLAEIAGLGIVEQFAYLLDMRRRLQTQLEQEVVMRRKCEQLIRVSSNLPDCLKLSSPYIQRILDRQKDEYEEEIRHQQQAMKHVKEQLKQVHEDELQRLKVDNDKLNSELTTLSHKLQELVIQFAKQEEKDSSCLPWVQHILDGTHEREMKHLKDETERLHSLCQEQQKQIREQCETMRLIERSSKQLEIDNETLAFKLSESLAQFDELEDQLRREATRARRESIFKTLAGKDANSKNNINKMLDNRPNVQESNIAEEQLKQLKEESSNLKEQLNSVQQQMEMMSLKYQQHKERYREKFYRLRDVQEQEQQEWRERCEGQSKELELLRDMLSREQQWRVQVEADCRQLKNDNQQLKNGVLVKNETDNDINSEAAVQREVEKLKGPRPSSATPSPSRRHSVWPHLPYPKKW